MVDRQKAIEAFIRCGTPGACSDKCAYFAEGFNCYRAMKHDLLELLKEQPEQKHGHWKLVQDYYDDEHWQCSACGCEWYLEAGNPKENNMLYCPECGAKMDEEVEQDG